MLKHLPGRQRTGHSPPVALGAVGLLAFFLVVLCPRMAVAQVDTGGVDVRAVAQKNLVRPGDQIAIAVVLKHNGGYHTWPAQDVLSPELTEFVDAAGTRTRIEVLEKPGWIARIDGIQWPNVHTAKVADPTGNRDTVEASVYSDVAVAFVRVVVAEAAAPGARTLTLRVSFQACNDKSCLFPTDADVPIELEVVPLTDTRTAAVNEPGIFSSFDVSQWGGGTAAPTPAVRPKPNPVQFNILGWRWSLDPSGIVGLSLLFLAAALGGLLLNFTPCVLPIIPLKIMGLSKSAGNRRRCFVLGVVMSLGVVFFWLAIGAAMAFVTSFKTISTLYQNPWFPLSVGVFMLVMGLGMFGAFAIRLPQAVYMVNPKGDTVPGSFLFGILTAVLSTPCTAPFMGAAAAWATFQPPATTLATFAAIGIGMALPYLILSANPQWIERLPRTGPGSELLKQVLGLLMLAVAAFFVGLPVAGWLNTPPDPVSRAYWWVVGALVATAGFWLAYRTFQITKRPGRRVVFGGGGLGAAALGLYLAAILSSHGPIKWIYYTPDRFAQAKSRGDTIVMDFTAEWCLNCKALESGVLHRRNIVSLLNSGDRIVPMKVDFTGDNRDGKAKLKEIQWVGIPLLAVFGPGVGYDDPIKMDNYTPEMVREAVEQARGKGVAQNAP